MYFSSLYNTWMPGKHQLFSAKNSSMWGKKGPLVGMSNVLVQTKLKIRVKLYIFSIYYRSYCPLQALINHTIG